MEEEAHYYNDHSGEFSTLQLIILVVVVLLLAGCLTLLLLRSVGATETPTPTPVPTTPVPTRTPLETGPQAGEDFYHFMIGNIGVYDPAYEPYYVCDDYTVIIMGSSFGEWINTATGEPVDGIPYGCDLLWREK